MQIIFHFLFYALLTVVFAAGIEWIRWKSSYGKVANLNKTWTKVIAVALFAAAVLIIEMNVWWHIVIYGLGCIGVRGMVYDPALNLYFGRYIDDESETTNSKTDDRERKLGLSFWGQRSAYFAWTVLMGLIFYFTTK